MSPIDGTMAAMAVIRKQDIAVGRASLVQWKDAAEAMEGGFVDPQLPGSVTAMAVRYSLHLLEMKAPGEGVEVRVAPWAAVKVLDGPASDPHNLTPPDVIELEPDVWLRVACGITTWGDERDAGHIQAISERDDLSPLLPLLI